MTNTNLLQQRIKDAGIKFSTIMKATGIKSYATLRGRINNDTEFTASEITAICDLLRIEKQDRDAIFFAKVSELYSA